MSVGLVELPVDPLLHILRYLDYKDIVSCAKTCHRLQQLTNEDLLWKGLCLDSWMVDRCPEGRSWRQHFTDWFKSFGKYIHCYKKIKHAWNQIESYTKRYCPDVYRSLNVGASESELMAVEDKIHESLPLDMRCSYRIHNGQQLYMDDEAGLFGNMTISGHKHHSYKSEHLLEIHKAAQYYSNSGEVQGTLPITFCPRSQISQFIAVCEDGGYIPGQIFYPCNSGAGSHSDDSPSIDNFISASSFTEWITEYAQELSNDKFPRYDGHIFRFYHEPSCVAVSGPITVSVATAFIPEMSSIAKPEFFFAYHITMSMDKNAPMSKSCKLETREWVITDADGHEEKVEGPGVVGEYPVMRPGACFNYTSCTTFKTTYGNMKGKYFMRSCTTGEEVVVEVPCFHMKCMPYQTTVDRYERRQHCKKNN